MPANKFDQFERRLIKLAVIGVCFWTVFIPLAYLFGRSEPPISEVVGVSIFVALMASIYYGMAVFIPLSNTHDRLKREYGESYTTILEESGRSVTFNGLWQAQARLLELEEQLKARPPQT